MLSNSNQRTAQQRKNSANAGSNRRARSHRQALILVATVVLGLGAFAYARYRADIDRARARVSTGSRIAGSRCGPIEYGEKGEGPPVLVVHGAGGGFDQGLELGEGLASAGFRVIAPSRFGYLGTPLPPEASAAAQANAHACLLDALGVPRAVIMGVSAGGPRRTVRRRFGGDRRLPEKSERGLRFAFLFVGVLWHRGRV